MPAKTDIKTELEILARLARKDTYEQISKETGVSIPAISAIKKRNQSALDIIKEKMIDHQISTSKKILNKSHSLIDRKLDRALRVEDDRSKLSAQLKAEEITQDEFQTRWRELQEPTLAELNAISKTAFDQSQIESFKPTSITGSSDQQQLVDLVDALKSGNEVELYKMVLSPSRDREIIEGEVV